MAYMINLVCGDSSYDGHGRTRSFLCLSSVNKEEIHRAYALGWKTLGVNLIEAEAKEYQKKTLNNKTKTTLKAHGFKVPEDIGPEEWVNLFIFTVTLGNPKIMLQRLEPDSVDIGGYTLV